MNVEIKARCSKHEEIRNILESKKAVFVGIDHQVDTYFKVNHGRMKLREGNIENFLIYYEREDKAHPKQSTVILFESDPDSSLKDILTKSLGVTAVVDKQREIYYVGNVKFHLDIVKDLETFVEIEAIDKDGTIVKDVLFEQCQAFLELFAIPEENLVASSYSDLLLMNS